MKKTRNFKLLSKATLIYLVFIFLAFLASAFVLSRLVDQFIQHDVEHFFTRFEEGWRRHPRLAGQLPRRNRKGPPFDVELIQHPEKLDMSKYPVYVDTVMYNPLAGENVVFRQKTTIVKWEGDVFKLTMAIPIKDFLQLRRRVFRALVPAFIILAIIIIGFNYIASGYLFRPFNRILDAMRTYQVGQEKSVDHVKTSTSEFVHMQNLFHQMIQRIESDYQRLKEYTENMAHEIQTPLAIIQNKTENLISNKEVMNENEKDVKVIWDEVTHLSKLGNTLNLITKIENREFSEIEEIQTKPILEKHLEALKELIEFKSLDVELDLSPEHALRINPYLLEILLKNLLRNALRYANTEGPVKIKTTLDELVISNYGDPLNFPHDKLFERFTRTSQDSRAMGLGLALVKKICDVNFLEISYEYKNAQHVFRITSLDDSNPQQ